MSDGLDRWFAEQILLHEDALMRFLGRRWPNRDEHKDNRQETYTRVYEAAAKLLRHHQSIHPVITLTANGGVRTNVRVGRPVTLMACGSWSRNGQHSAAGLKRFSKFGEQRREEIFCA